MKSNEKIRINIVVSFELVGTHKKSMLGQVVSAIIPLFRERRYIGTLLSYLSLARGFISPQYIRVSYILDMCNLYRVMFEQ